MLFNTVLVYADEFFQNYQTRTTLKRINVSWVNNVTAIRKLGCECMNCIAICSECR